MVRAIATIAPSAGWPKNPLSELNAAIKTSAREILKNLETYIDQRVVEVADTVNSYGMIRYMCSNGGGSNADFYAYAYYAHTEAIGRDVHLNPVWDTQLSANFSSGAGSNGYTTLRHETLHALGLKHPGDYDTLSHGTDGPFLDPSQDHKSNTVMSYNHVGTASITPLSYGFDRLDLTGNQRSALRLTNNAGDLVIDWRNGDSIRVKGYFAALSAAAMPILIEGEAFIATATGAWQRG